MYHYTARKTNHLILAGMLTLLLSLFTYSAVQAAAIGTSTDCATSGTLNTFSLPAEQCQVLVDLYNNTDGANWTAKTNWDDTKDPCTWYGVICDDTKTNVIWIDLFNNNLVGTIPPVDALTELKAFYLYENQLTGSIPALPNGLLYMALDNNQLDGNIPALPDTLQFVTLHNNALTGSIPTLPADLEILDISNNNLTGSIPTLPANLVLAYFENNLLSGSIPTLPSGLQEFSASGNALTGSIPALPSTLQRLWLYDNQLSGSIPALSADLETFIAYNNSLSGSIPALPANLAYLDLNTNSLSGSIPTLPASLLYLDLSFNSLSGSIPTMPAGLRELYLASNTLDGNLPAFSAGLQFAVLSNNALTGSIPALPSGLIGIDLSINNLTGSIPTLPIGLLGFGASSNSLTGSIPTLPGNLLAFDVSTNSLSGSLPDLPSSLGVLKVNDNSIIGTIPATITSTAIAVGDLSLCGGGNSLISPSAGVTTFVQARDSGWTDGCGQIIFTSPLPPTDGAVGIPYSHTFTAIGSPAPTFSISGTLPAGLTFDGATGVLSGTPTTVTATTTFTVTASNGVAADATQTFDLTISNPTAPTITSALPPGTGAVGVAYSHTFTATGSPVPTFSLSGTLPAGLTFNGTTGVLSGIPTTATASASFTVTASNGINPDDTQTFTLEISSAPAFTSAVPQAVIAVDTAFSHTFTASGTPDPTFSVTSGTLPTGLTLNSTTGVLSGTPTTVAAPVTLTVTASNGVSPAATQTFSLEVVDSAVAPKITSNLPPDTGAVGIPYSHTFTASGSPNATFSVAVGTLPDGLTLNSVTGVLSGTPTTLTPAAYYIVTASNGVDPADSQLFPLTITVASAPRIISSEPPDGAVSTEYSHTFRASGSPDATFTVTAGTLPNGLTLNSITGVLSGTPTTPYGPASITVTASNGVAPDHSQTFTLSIQACGSGKATSASDGSYAVGCFYGTVHYDANLNGLSDGGDGYPDGAVLTSTTSSVCITVPNKHIPTSATCVQKDGGGRVDFGILKEGTVSITSDACSGMRVIVPNGAVPAGTGFNLVQNTDSSGDLAKGIKMVRAICDITTTTGQTNFNDAILVCATHTDADILIAGGYVGNLRIGYYDGTQWQALPSANSSDTETCGTSNHLTRFGLVALTPGSLPVTGAPESPPGTGRVWPSILIVVGLSSLSGLFWWRTR